MNLSCKPCVCMWLVPHNPRVLEYRMPTTGAQEPVACGWVSSLLRLVLDPLQQLAVLLNPTFGWYAWMDWPGLGW